MSNLRIFRFKKYEGKKIINFYGCKIMKKNALKEEKNDFFCVKFGSFVFYT